MAVLTVDNIETYLGVTFSPTESDRVEMILDMAIGEVEGYLGRPVGATQFTEEVEIDEGGRIYVWNTPVVSVESVTLNANVVDPSWWRATKWGVQYLDTYPGIWDPVYVNPLGWGWLGEIATVEYTAGIDKRAINSLLLSGTVRRLNELHALDAPVTPVATNCDDGTSTPVEPDLTGVSGAVKRIQVEDFEVEYETTSTLQAKMYQAKASPLPIFASELDFITIKQYKRVRTA